MNRTVACGAGGGAVGCVTGWAVVTYWPAWAQVVALAVLCLVCGWAIQGLRSPS